jgi:hypothetical protein
MSEALFYPWIDIRDEAWLKASLLYWDSVRQLLHDAERRSRLRTAGSTACGGRTHGWNRRTFGPQLSREPR